MYGLERKRASGSLIVTAKACATKATILLHSWKFPLEVGLSGNCYLFSHNSVFSLGCTLIIRHIVQLLRYFFRLI